MTIELHPKHQLPGQRGSLQPVEDVLAERHLMRYGCHPIGCLIAGAVLGYVLLCLLW